MAQSNKGKKQPASNSNKQTEQDHPERTSNQGRKAASGGKVNNNNRGHEKRR